MRLVLTRAAALAAAVAAATPSRSAEATTPLTEYLLRFVVEAALGALRAELPMVWRAIEARPASSEVAIHGLILRPNLDWDPGRACAISAARVDFGLSDDWNGSRFRMDVSNLKLAPQCLPPDASETLKASGVGPLFAEHAMLDMRYAVGPSALDATLHATFRGLGSVEAAAAFDYVAIESLVTEPMGTTAPAAILRSAEILYEDAGLWEKVRPALEQQVGDLAMAPAMVEMGVRQSLAGPPETARPLTPEEDRFATSLGEALRSFIGKPGRLSVAIAPERPVAIPVGGYAEPGEAVAMLAPTASTSPLAARSLVDPALLAADPAGLSAEEKRRLGLALLTGRGAPRSVAAGRALLAPLAEAGDAGAATALAEGLAQPGAGPETLAEAYRAALGAAAAGSTDALAMLGALEARMPLGTVLAAQAEAEAGWPGRAGAQAALDAATAAGDRAALRRAALDRTAGSGAPRSYAAAYAHAALAAAAGDRAALALRDRLDLRFAEADAADRAAWRALADAAEAEAFAAWIGGFGAAVAEAMR